MRSSRTTRELAERIGATLEDGRPGIRAANTYEDLELKARQVSEARLIRDTYEAPA